MKINIVKHYSPYYSDVLLEFLLSYGARIELINSSRETKTYRAHYDSELVEIILTKHEDYDSIQTRGTESDIYDQTCNLMEGFKLQIQNYAKKLTI